MMLFVLVPSELFPNATTIDAAWSLDEQPDAFTLAANRVEQLRAAGIDARVHPHGGSFITPVAGSRMVH